MSSSNIVADASSEGSTKSDISETTQSTVSGSVISPATSLESASEPIAMTADDKEGGNSALTATKAEQITSIVDDKPVTDVAEDSPRKKLAAKYDSDSDNEDAESLFEEVSSAMYDRCIGIERGNEELLEARKQAPTRVLQYQQYIGSMEDRIKYLEAELVDMRRLVEGSKNRHHDTDDSEDDEEHDDKERDDEERPDAETTDQKTASTEPKEVGPKCECRVLSYKDYVKGKHVKSYVVSTLSEAAEPYNRTIVSGETKDIVVDHGGLSNRISRLCINSTHIIEFLDQHLPKGAALSKHMCIILRPFKPLCQLETKIREQLARLETEIERREKEKSGKDPAPKIEEDSPDVTDFTGYAESVQNGDEPEQSISDHSIEAVTTARNHFKTLIELMDGDLKEVLDSHKLYRQLNTKIPSQIRYEDLWHLFVPGQVVYTEQPNRQAFIVLNVRGGRRLHRPMIEQVPIAQDPEKRTTIRIENKSHSNFYMDCVHIDFDGTDLGFLGQVLEIPYYKGERDIASLPVVPIDLADKKGGLSCHEYLQNRGRKFLMLTREGTEVGYAHRDYVGTSLQDTDPETQKLTSREQIDSQVIVDFEHAYLQPGRKPTFSFPSFPDPEAGEIPDGIVPTGPARCSICGPASGCNESRESKCYDDRLLDKASRQEIFTSDKLGTLEGDLTEAQLIILPSYVQGYVLRNLDWYRLDVDLLVAPKATTNFQDLVLPPENRDLVESLVKARRSHASTRARQDVVRGKGQGIIVLLHGVPGTGKSSTAECVAESLKCPLFTITCGNIGTKPDEVQNNLQTMFYMANKWNCVMLLDEADVFLQERDERDMERNAVVSVFLRALEYYSGILFLTTNKVGKFDEAFVSRIHQAIEYPALNKDTTRSIWQVNLRKLKEKRPNVEFDSDRLLSFAGQAWEEQYNLRRVTWNGRQIRNAFQTAVALAEHSALRAPQSKENDKGGVIHLEMEHFLKVLQVSHKFDEYLRKTRKNRDWLDIAQMKQDRYDDRRSDGMQRPPQPNFYGQQQAYPAFSQAGQIGSQPGLLFSGSPGHVNQQSQGGLQSSFLQTGSPPPSSNYLGLGMNAPQGNSQQSNRPEYPNQQGRTFENTSGLGEVPAGYGGQSQASFPSLQQSDRPTDMSMMSNMAYMQHMNQRP